MNNWYMQQHSDSQNNYAKSAKLVQEIHATWLLPHKNFRTCQLKYNDSGKRDLGERFGVQKNLPE